MFRISYIATALLCVLASVTQGQDEPAQPSQPKEVQTEQEKALAAIEKLGGKVTFDEGSPGRPVIAVNLGAPRSPMMVLYTSSS